MKSSIKRYAVSIGVVISISGCASIGEVGKEDRDLTNSYDGYWIAKPESTDSLQIYRSWEFNCGQFTAPIALRIENSGIQAHVYHEYVAPLKEAYISSNGDFKTALPTGITGKTTQSSDVIHSDIEIRLIVRGNLVPEGHGTGVVTIGWAVSQYNGCKTKLVFTKDYLGN